MQMHLPDYLFADLVSTVAFGVVAILLIVLGYVAALRRAELWRDLIAARRAEWDAAVEADRAKSELQSLRGIIPICSHCHRVRIEDGRLEEIA